MVADANSLFAEHRQRLFRYFYRAVGQPEAARDLTQDVFVRMTRSPATTEERTRAWVFRIARNLAIDYGRSQQRRTTAPLDENTGRPPTQHVSLEMTQALAGLSDLDRDVFLMREVGGLSYEEVGRACDLTPHAVRSRIHRTRLHLRGQLTAPIAQTRTTPMRQRHRQAE